MSLTSVPHLGFKRLLTPTAPSPKAISTCIRARSAVCLQPARTHTFQTNSYNVTRSTCLPPVITDGAVLTIWGPLFTAARTSLSPLDSWPIIRECLGWTHLLTDTLPAVVPRETSA
jgi:hypothetical protein